MKPCILVVGATLICIMGYAQTHWPINDSSYKFKIINAPTKIKETDYLIVLIMKGNSYTINKKAFRRAFKRNILDTSFISKSYVVRTNELPPKQKNRLPQIVFNIKDSIPKKSVKKLKSYLKPPPL